MRVWLDGQCLQTQSRYRGIGRYVISLIRSLAEQYPDLELMVSLSAAMPNEALEARKKLTNFIPEDSIYVWQPANIQPEAISGYDNARKISELALSYHVELLNPDLVLSLSPFEGAYDLAVPYNPRYKRNTKVVQIFYDAIPERFQDNYLSDNGYKKMYFRRKSFYDNSDFILSISDFSDNEAIDLYSGVKSTPIYAGVDRSFFDNKQILQSTSVEEFDFLYVGALDFRKNIPALLKAVSIIASQNNEMKKLGIIGSFNQTGRDEVKNLWASLRLDPKYLSIYENVSDNDLLQYYRNAKVVVQPSLMEGFGLTALEAIFAESCVAGSRGTAMEEIILDDRALFDPRDENDIAKVLLSLSKDEKLRNEVIKIQKRSLEKFSWKKTAELTYKHLLNVGSNINATPDKSKVRNSILSEFRDIASPYDVLSLSEIFAANEIVQKNRPNILAIDATATTEFNHKTGIQRVVCNIIKNVGFPLEQFEFDLSLLYCDDWSGWYDIGKVIGVSPEKHKIYNAQKGDIILLLDSSWNYHTQQDYALWDARLKGADVISCLYDTVPLKFSAFCSEEMTRLFSAWFRTALSYSTGFICISKAVADDLLKILQAIQHPCEMKIGYWQLGTDFKTPNIETIIGSGRSTSIKTRKSFLMVGTMEPRKAHHIALDAFEKLWEKNCDIELVIVGKMGWDVSDLLRRIEFHTKLGSQLIVKHNVDDADLLELYRNCDALLACSYAEGFGLPIVEAGQLGKPIIASDIPVFREVSKSAPEVYFFPVGSSTGLADAVSRFIENKSNQSAWTLPHWPNWQESSSQLVDVVIGQQWYTRYIPRQDSATTDPNNVCNHLLLSKLTKEQTAHKLEVIDKITTTDVNSRILVKIAVTNLSNMIWSSFVDNQNNIPVKLGIQVVLGNGSIYNRKFPLIEFLFPIIPNETIYLPIRLYISDLPKNASELEIRLMQEDYGWWEPGIRVRVDKSALLSSPKK